MSPDRKMMVISLSNFAHLMKNLPRNNSFTIPEMSRYIGKSVSQCYNWRAVLLQFGLIEVYKEEMVMRVKRRGLVSHYKLSVMGQNVKLNMSDMYHFLEEYE